MKTAMELEANGDFLPKPVRF